nr:unnamed protein product [Digitaria exilis]
MPPPRTGTGRDQRRAPGSRASEPENRRGNGRSRRYLTSGTGRGERDGDEERWFGGGGESEIGVSDSIRRRVAVKEEEQGKGGFGGRRGGL